MPIPRGLARLEGPPDAPRPALGATVLIRAPTAEGRGAHEAAEVAARALELRQKIESFGSVAHVTHMAAPGKGALVVSYTDCEAAARARESLGDDCVPISPSGLERPPGIDPAEPASAATPPGAAAPADPEEAGYSSGDGKHLSGASVASTEAESVKGAARTRLSTASASTWVRTSTENSAEGASDTSTEAETAKGAAHNVRWLGAVGADAVKAKYGLLEAQAPGAAGCRRPSGPARLGSLWRPELGREDPAASRGDSGRTRLWLRGLLRRLCQAGELEDPAASRGDSGRTRLWLRGLPRRLCQSGELEAMLRAHGFMDAVASLRWPSTRGSQIGSVALELKSPAQASSIAKFFHGRLFGNSMPVAVTFANKPGNVMPLKKAC